jgi:triosephosphate isomerase
MRRPFIAGNWKMNGTVAEAEALVQALLPRVGAVDDVDVVVCPPFLAQQAVVDTRPTTAPTRGRCRRRCSRRSMCRA